MTHEPCHGWNCCHCHRLRNCVIQQTSNRVAIMEPTTRQVGEDSNLPDIFTGIQQSTCKLGFIHTTPNEQMPFAFVNRLTRADTPSWVLAAGHVSGWSGTSCIEGIFRLRLGLSDQHFLGCYHAAAYLLANCATDEQQIMCLPGAVLCLKR